MATICNAYFFSFSLLIYAKQANKNEMQEVNMSIHKKNTTGNLGDRKPRVQSS